MYYLFLGHVFYVTNTENYHSLWPDLKFFLKIGESEANTLKQSFFFFSVLIYYVSVSVLV